MRTNDGAGSAAERAGAVGVQVHRVGPDEWESHRDLRLAMIDAEPDAFWFPPDIRTRWGEQEWRDDATGPRIHLQARRAGDVLGGIGVLPQGYVPEEPIGPDEAHLVSLWVRPEARGQGIARLLVRASGQLAIDLGRPLLSLHVDSRNTGAQTLYGRLGFVRTDVEHPRESTGSVWLQYEIDARTLLAEH